jgi:uncharacterized membrane protein (UPF0127 family)
VSQRIVRNATTGEVILGRATWCASPWCHFRGLMLRGPLTDDEGLLFVYGGESRSLTSIHMLFMRYSIGVVWMDAQGVVVDTTLAKPWRLYYAAQKPAQYFIEANPSILDRVSTNDRLRFDEEAPV